MLHSASGGIRLRLSAIAITDFSFAKPKLKEAAKSGASSLGRNTPGEERLAQGDGRYCTGNSYANLAREVGKRTDRSLILSFS
jgi:hypothetical protein